jgi:hypothetical protein
MLTAPSGGKCEVGIASSAIDPEICNEVLQSTHLADTDHQLDRSFRRRNATRNVLGSPLLRDQASAR